MIVSESERQRQRQRGSVGDRDSVRDRDRSETRGETVSETASEIERQRDRKDKKVLILIEERKSGNNLNQFFFVSPYILPASS